MVGFGFMDNIIMIQAGDLIDSTLGVTLGITTLTAAALGNVCSDSSGVLFGGVVERASERLNLAQPDFTPEQADSSSAKMANTLGSLLGVICGCLLGMSTLLFMDMEATERLKRAQQLETIFEPVMNSAKSEIRCERCTLYLYDEEKRQLWTKQTSGGPATIITLDIDAKHGLAAVAAREKRLINVRDAWEDPRFDSQWDKRTGLRTRQVLCFPITDSDGKLYGCLQAINTQEGKPAFTVDDEKLLRMLSSHISIFVAAVCGGDD
jgi:transcriptional regulator with GAF, ATPase, and Fis domain